MKKRRDKFRHRRKVYLCPCAELLPVGYNLMSMMLTGSLNARLPYSDGGDGPFMQIDFQNELGGREAYGDGGTDVFEIHSPSGGRNPYGSSYSDPFSIVE